jgi:hypothetical protein
LAETKDREQKDIRTKQRKKHAFIERQRTERHSKDKMKKKT